MNLIPQTKLSWLAWTSCFSILFIATYIICHQFKDGEERVSLNKEQLSAINSIIATSSQESNQAPVTPLPTDTTVHSTDTTAYTAKLASSVPGIASEAKLKQHVITYINDALDLRNPKSLVALVNSYDIVHLQAILPTYRFRVNSFFWLTGKKLLLEVVFWSIFGLIANLMYSVTTASVFDPKRVPEHIGKVFYTPFMTIIIYLSVNALTNSGSITFEGVGKNVVVLSFILGFFTKRSIELLKKVRDLVLPAEQENGANDSSDEEAPADDLEDLANLAISQNQENLKQKYPDLIESMQPGAGADNTALVKAILKQPAPVDFPTSLVVQQNGESKSVEMQVLVSSSDGGQQTTNPEAAK